MPIDDNQLERETNAHILRPATDTVYQALRAWRDTPNSYEWWWLIIEHEHRRYTAIRLEDLRELLAAPDSGVTMTTRLAALPARRDNPHDWQHPLPGVVTPTVVEKSAMGTARALQAMEDSPGRLLVVLHDGHFRGILSSSQRTFAFADKLLMDMLDEFEAGGDDDTAILNPPPESDAPSDLPPQDNGR